MVYKNQEYKKYRVKSAIKSFRDLEVYKRTTELSAELYQIEAPKNCKKSLEKEFAILMEISKHIPKLVAESYGDKFSNFNMGIAKLEKAMQLISDTISKIDFLTVAVDDKNKEFKEILDGILKKYQIQRRKILNLKNAWSRVFSMPKKEQT
jgi:hypothetical protein